MAFKDNDVSKLLAQCHRRCCVCHKFCGVKMELHHVEHKADGGPDDIGNAIPLCFECHAEVNHYNDAHPKGRKFSNEELLEHKRQWLEICSSNPGVLVSAPRDRDVGPLEGMVLELKFNLDTAQLVTGSEPWQDKIGCALLMGQYQKAIEEGTLLLIPDSLRKTLNRAYFEVGKVNSFIAMYTSTRPEGNAFAEATNRLLDSLRKSEPAINQAYSDLQAFLLLNGGDSDGEV